MVVKNCTCHFAVADHFNTFCQSINTKEVDVFANCAAAAIQKAGRTVGEDIYLLGVDALTECVEMIGNGEMTGTVLNDHIGQSHTAVDVAIKLLNEEAVDNYYWVDYVKVDKAYVDAQ